MATHTEYDAVVIGSGLGGLTAGAWLAHERRKVLVLEKNDSFGGCASTYRRGPLVVEASLHETADPRSGGDPRDFIFKKLDLYKDVEFVDIDNFYEVRSSLIGDPLVIPHGTEKACSRLSEKFPHDADAIHHFFCGLDAIQTLLHAFSGKHPWKWWLSHVMEFPYYFWSLLRDWRSSLRDVLNRYFKDNEALKVALAANLFFYSDDPDQLWWIMYAVAQGQYIRDGSKFIKGGSQRLTDALVSRIEEADGEAVSGHEVTKLLVNDKGEVYEILYKPREGGQEVVARSKLVFANASPHAVSRMLPTSSQESFMEQFQNRHLSLSLMTIVLGLKKKPAELGVTSYNTILVPHWMRKLKDFKQSAELLANYPEHRLPVLAVVDYSHIDSGLVEDGIYPVNIGTIDHLSNWNTLSEDEYKLKRDAWVDAIIERLDLEWPGLKNVVAQRECMTAKSYHEYLGTPEGALYGFAPTVPEHAWKAPGSPKTSVKGLWLASAFGTAGGGYPGAIISGWIAAKWASKHMK